MLGNDGVFLYPTFPTAAPMQKLAVLRTIGGIYCLLANVFGCPATHVPMGLNKDGLPIGFQVKNNNFKIYLTFLFINKLF